MNRVRQGNVLVRNPRNPKHVIDVSLRPQDVIAVVYWSRDYGRLLPHLPELDERGLSPCFHLTLTGYGPPLELRGPSADAVIDQFARLAERYGPDRIAWRYDPIVLGSRHGVSFHEDNFEVLAIRIAPFARRCIVSFLDPYPSTRRELAAIEATGLERFDSPVLSLRRGLAARLVRIAKDHGLSISACCEVELGDLIAPARCIDADWIGTFTHAPPTAFRSSPTRKGCGCAFARDIGAYQTCGHGCVYCYANESPDVGLRNARAVQPEANHLGEGTLEARAPVRSKTYESGQLSLGNVLAAPTYDGDEPHRE